MGGEQLGCLVGRHALRVCKEEGGWVVGSEGGEGGREKWGASSLAAWSGATPCAFVKRKEGGWWAWKEEKEGVISGGRAAWLPGRAPRPARL